MSSGRPTPTGYGGHDEWTNGDIEDCTTRPCRRNRRCNGAEHARPSAQADPQSKRQSGAEGCPAPEAGEGGTAGGTERESVMQTHDDRDARLTPAWLDSLRDKADAMTEAGESQITAGKPGEKPIADYVRAGVRVMQLPDDEHGILRLSIGGHPAAPFDTAYLVFRGDRGQCQSLLRRALKALEYSDANGR
jgi:hypothetical protein